MSRSKGPGQAIVFDAPSILDLLQDDWDGETVQKVMGPSVTDKYALGAQTTIAVDFKSGLLSSRVSALGHLGEEPH